MNRLDGQTDSISSDPSGQGRVSKRTFGKLTLLPPKTLKKKMTIPSMLNATCVCTNSAFSK